MGKAEEMNNPMKYGAYCVFLFSFVSGRLPEGHLRCGLCPLMALKLGDTEGSQFFFFH